VVLIL